jgi:hypothetical protein
MWTRGEPELDLAVVISPVGGKLSRQHLRE